MNEPWKRDSRGSNRGYFCADDQLRWLKLQFALSDHNAINPSRLTPESKSVIWHGKVTLNDLTRRNNLWQTARLCDDHKLIQSQYSTQ